MHGGSLWQKCHHLTHTVIQPSAWVTKCWQRWCCRLQLHACFAPCKKKLACLKQSHSDCMTVNCRGKTVAWHSDLPLTCDHLWRWFLPFKQHIAEIKGFRSAAKHNKDFEWKLEPKIAQIGQLHVTAAKNDKYDANVFRTEVLKSYNGGYYQHLMQVSAARIILLACTEKVDQKVASRGIPALPTVRVASPRRSQEQKKTNREMKTLEIMTMDELCEPRYGTETRTDWETILHLSARLSVPRTC